jgi:hypothetical protein
VIGLDCITLFELDQSVVLSNLLTRLPRVPKRARPRKSSAALVLTLFNRRGGSNEPS